MSRLEKLRKKIKDKPKQVMLDFEGFVQNVRKEAIQEATESTQVQLIENVDKMIVEVKRILSEQSNGFQGVIAYLELQKEKLQETEEGHKKYYFEIVDGISQLAKQADKTQKVSITNPAKLKVTKAEMRQAFIEGLEGIQKILVAQNEEPSRIEGVMGADGRIQRIEEEYTNFSLVHNFTWERGKFTITTEKR